MLPLTHRGDFASPQLADRNDHFALLTMLP